MQQSGPRTHPPDLDPHRQGAPRAGGAMVGAQRPISVQLRPCRVGRGSGGVQVSKGSAPRPLVLHCAHDSAARRAGHLVKWVSSELPASHVPQVAHVRDAPRARGLRCSWSSTTEHQGEAEDRQACWRNQQSAMFRTRATWARRQRSTIRLQSRRRRRSRYPAGPRQNHQLLRQFARQGRFDRIGQLAPAEEGAPTWGLFAVLPGGNPVAVLLDLDEDVARPAADLDEVDPGRLANLLNERVSGAEDGFLPSWPRSGRRVRHTCSGGTAACWNSTMLGEERWRRIMGISRTGT